MKITTFNPMICTTHPEEIIALFEALGFERRHTKTNLGDGSMSDVRMALGDFRVDVATVPTMPQDVMMIRMNADNFEEAYEFLLSKGFRNSQGDTISESASGKGTSMISPSGFIIALSKHKK